MSRLEHPLSHEDLMAYADGEMESRKAARAAEHLDECRECSAIVNDVKLLSMQLASWQVEESPDAVAQGVPTELESLENARKSSGSQRSWPSVQRGLVYGLGGAFAFLVLLIFVAVPGLLRSRQAAPNAQVVREEPALPAAGPAPTAEPLIEQSQSGQPRGQQSQQGQQGQAQPPMVIRTISLAMITRTFDAARTKIDNIVRQSQGYIDRMTVHGDGGSARSLSATLRLPAAQSDSASNELKTIGRLMQESQNSSDITSQYVDLAARLSNAHNSEQRLLTLLRERAGDLKDVVAMEREISSVRENIERMEAQQKDLDNKVKFVTIQLELTEEYHAALEPPAPSTQTELRNAAIDGIRSGGENIIDIAVFLLRYGPSLLIWSAALGAVILVIMRMQGIELRRRS
jgi:hypothetical protein